MQQADLERWNSEPVCWVELSEDEGEVFAGVAEEGALSRWSFYTCRIYKVFQQCCDML